MLDAYETASGSILDLQANPEFRPFIGRVQSVLADPRASLDDMIELVYGPENPVTDETVIPKSPAQSAHVDEPPAVVVPNVEREPVDQFGKAWYAPANPGRRFSCGDRLLLLA